MAIKVAFNGFGALPESLTNSSAAGSVTSVAMTEAEKVEADRLAAILANYAQCLAQKGYRHGVVFHRAGHVAAWAVRNKVTSARYDMALYVAGEIARGAAGK